MTLSLAALSPSDAPPPILRGNIHPNRVTTAAAATFSQSQEGTKFSEAAGLSLKKAQPLVGPITEKSLSLSRSVFLTMKFGAALLGGVLPSIITDHIVFDFSATSFFELVMGINLLMNGIDLIKKTARSATEYSLAKLKILGGLLLLIPSAITVTEITLSFLKTGSLNLLEGSVASVLETASIVMTVVFFAVIGCLQTYTLVKTLACKKALKGESAEEVYDKLLRSLEIPEEKKTLVLSLGSDVVKELIKLSKQATVTAAEKQNLINKAKKSNDRIVFQRVAMLTFFSLTVTGFALMLICSAGVPFLIGAGLGVAASAGALCIKTQLLLDELKNKKLGRKDELSLIISILLSSFLTLGCIFSLMNPIVILVLAVMGATSLFINGYSLYRVHQQRVDEQRSL